MGPPIQGEENGQIPLNLSKNTLTVRVISGYGQA